MFALCSCLNFLYSLPLNPVLAKPSLTTKHNIFASIPSPNKSPIPPLSQSTQIKMPTSSVFKSFLRFVFVMIGIVGSWLRWGFCFDEWTSSVGGGHSRRFSLWWTVRFWCWWWRRWLIVWLNGEGLGVWGFDEKKGVWGEILWLKKLFRVFLENL